MCGSRRPIPVRSAVGCLASLVMATFPPSLLRLKAAADNAVAIARRYVDPGFRIAIELRGSSTRVVAGRCAIVLAGLRDAVALLRLERGGRRDRLLCGERDRCDDGRGQSGCDQIASVHAYLPMSCGVAYRRPSCRHRRPLGYSGRPGQKVRWQVEGWVPTPRPAY